MSLLSVGDIITLVNAIQSQVKNYENNNAIVKVYDNYYNYNYNN